MQGAKLKIYNVPNMTEYECKAIAEWLRTQAEKIEVAAFRSESAGSHTATIVLNSEINDYP